MGTIQRLQKACQLVKKRKKAYIKNVELKSGADLEDESCRDSKPISAGNRKGNDLCNFLQMLNIFKYRERRHGYSFGTSFPSLIFIL